ncbi:MnmA/TRMU family protein [Demequina litorisediminis]|uniref:MnmA/TRMU family protein n=1 Tax=Demequina litorisediminis TaxID=1849022 RepID=UPI003D6777AD
MRVLAALSGGVDSAVAAARAVDAGHDVVGVHMALSRNRDEFRSGARGCCSIEDSNDARRAADKLGIPYYVWDLSDEFHDLVVRDFLDEYAAGRTPNPCVRCNEHIKFDTLLERAEVLGFDAVATGHYARAVTREDGVRELHRARDAAKDQSYVLAVMGPEKARAVPVPARGHVLKVRGSRRGGSARPRGQQQAGLVRHLFCGRWRHQGLPAARTGRASRRHRRSRGRRRRRSPGRLRVHRRPAQGPRHRASCSRRRPRYVTGVDTTRNVVTVGPETLLSVSTLVGDATVWLAPDVAADAPVACHAQVRAHGAPTAGTVVRNGDRLTVELDEPMRGVAAGQSLVVYQGTRVLGQATLVGRSL